MNLSLTIVILFLLLKNKYLINLTPFCDDFIFVSVLQGKSDFDPSVSFKKGEKSKCLSKPNKVEIYIRTLLHDQNGYV